MDTEFLEAKTLIAVNLTGVAADKNLTFNDLGVEQGGGGHREGQKQCDYTEFFHFQSDLL